MATTLIKDHLSEGAVFMATTFMKGHLGESEGYAHQNVLVSPHVGSQM